MNNPFPQFLAKTRSPGQQRYAAGLALLVCANLLPGAARAMDVLSVCIPDGYLPPLTGLQGETPVQLNIRKAAAQVGWDVSFVARPWRRCIKEVADGQLQAIIGVAPAAENMSRMVFPMRDGKPDGSRAVTKMVIVAYRPLGSRAQWDGKHFSGLQGPVLYIGGGVFIAEALARYQVQMSDAVQQPEVLMSMLLAGRSNLAVDVEERVVNLMQRHEFRGRFEILPDPLIETGVFTAMSPSFYDSNQQRVERFWTLIGQLQHAAQRH